MGLRTPEQYKQSLRDGRAVYFRGEKVADVTKHPVIGIAVEHACIDYRMTEDPKYRGLAVIKEGAASTAATSICRATAMICSSAAN